MLCAAVAVGLLLGNACLAAAQSQAPAPADLTLLAPGSIRQALADLTPRFEQKTGQKVKVTLGSGGGTKQQAARGEAFDVFILQPPFPDVLASGNVVAATAVPLATVSVGVAVRKGAARPDISTADAVKRMLLAAQSITYADPASAASGVSVNDALKKLGIADQLRPKIKLAPNPLALVAKGDAEIALLYLADMSDPGIEVVGPLPRDVSTPTGFVGFVSAHAKDPAAAKALLDFLSSPEAAPVYKAKGMQPGA